MVIVTLIGKRQAHVGNQFVYTGQVWQCSECSLRKVCCEKLENDRVYTVLAVRSKFHDCPIHEDGVQLVDVEEATSKISMPLHQIFERAVFTFHPIICDKWGCSEISTCNPTGLKDGDKCRIEQVIQKTALDCSEGHKLGHVLVKRVS